MEHYTREEGNCSPVRGLRKLGVARLHGLLHVPRLLHNFLHVPATVVDAVLLGGAQARTTRSRARLIEDVRFLERPHVRVGEAHRVQLACADRFVFAVGR